MTPPRAIYVLVGLLPLSVVGCAASSSDRYPSPHHAHHAHHTSHHRRVVQHYSPAERITIREMDIAAGKAAQAAMSSDGTYEGRTAQRWCSVVNGLSYDVIHPHSLKWAGRVEKASDETSKMLNGALKFCT